MVWRQLQTIILAVLVAGVWVRADVSKGNISMKDSKDRLLFVGTYLKGDSKGIYACHFDEQSGQLTLTGQTLAIPNPSFLAADPSGGWLYAVCETPAWEGKPTGAVSALRIEGADGTLRLINQVSSHGKAPCHLSLDPARKIVAVANYSSGTVASFPVAADGSLGEAASVIQHGGSGPNEKRQKGPHAHSITVDPANRFAYAADLGIDRILVYRIEHAAGKLVPMPGLDAVCDPGSGPRHVAFHPRGTHLYVVNELGCSVTVFSWNAETGALHREQTISTLPADFSGENSCADIHLSDDAGFLYASNRGHDSIAVFAVSPADGSLTPLGYRHTGGKCPRNFAISPSGTWLLAANQDSSNVVVFPLDRQTGLLGEAQQTVEIPFPVCVRFVPPF